MSKLSTAVTNENKNEVWKQINGDTSTSRSGGAVYDKLSRVVRGGEAVRKMGVV